MGFEFYKESYTGSIKEISIGDGGKAVTVGGETCYPFYQFEGEMPNKPRIAMEIWDMEPEIGRNLLSAISRMSFQILRPGQKNVLMSSELK